MTKLILSLVMLTSLNAQAGDLILKNLNCQGATLEMVLQVVQETYPGSVPTVAWTVRDGESGAVSQFMGYLFSDGGVREFRSTDLGSDVEVSGSVAVLKMGTKEEALFCK